MQGRIIHTYGARELHHSRMRQRHDLVQAPGMVGLSHLGVGQVGKRDPIPGSAQE